MTGPRFSQRVIPNARIAVRAALDQRLRVLLPIDIPFDPAPPTPPQILLSDILVMGHSLVDDRIMDALRSWAIQGARAVDISQGITPGASAAWHWDHAPAKGVEGRAWLVDPGVDLFSYAEAGPLNALGGSAEAPSLALDYGHRWAQAAWTNGAQPFLAEIWPYIDSGAPGYIGSERAGDDPLAAMLWRPKIDALRSHYEAILGYVQAPLGAAPFRLIPGGALMAALHDAALAGSLTGIDPSEPAFFAKVFSDDIHLTPYGWYALACLYFACFYQLSPVGLSNLWYHTDWDGAPPYDGMPSETEAAELQALAWTVAQADDLGPFGAVFPADPYAGAGGSAPEWWAPMSNDLVLTGDPQTVTAFTIALSFRFHAGDLEGAAPDLVFSGQFVRLQVAGGDDGSGRGLACQLVTTGWAQTDLTALAGNFMAVGESQNVVLIYDAAGLPGGNRAEVWVNGDLVMVTSAAIPNVGLQHLRIFSNGGLLNGTPNRGETQGWWISLTTAVPAASLFADVFDGPSGLRQLTATTIDGITPDAVQIGVPAT